MEYNQHLQCMITAVALWEVIHISGLKQLQNAGKIRYALLEKSHLKCVYDDTFYFPTHVSLQ